MVMRNIRNWISVGGLALLMLVGGWMRFTHLDWGDPWWFHPDERNVAMAVTRLEWPERMDPEFFAYGSFPIYLFYAGLELAKWMGNESDPFGIAIMVSRMWSAGLSVVLIPLMWWAVNRYFSRDMAWLTAILTTFTSGYVQFSHYGTFEMWLTVMSLVLMICFVEFVRDGNPWWLLAGSIVFGLSVGTKVTSLTFGPALALAVIWRASLEWREKRRKLGEAEEKELAREVDMKREVQVGDTEPADLEVERKVEVNPGGSFAVGERAQDDGVSENQSKTIDASNPETQDIASLQTVSKNRKKTDWSWLGMVGMIGLNGTMLVMVGLAVFMITNPYAFNETNHIAQALGSLSKGEWESWDGLFNPDFLHSIRSEGGIARGTVDVFYTRQFQNTIPGWFQLMKVFPYILGWPSLILGIGGLMWMLGVGVRFKKVEWLFVPLWWIIQMAFLVTLYVKWSRYMIPTLPYMTIAAAWVGVIVFRLLKREGKKMKVKTAGYRIKMVGAGTLLLLWLGWHGFMSMAYANIFRQTDSRLAAAAWAEKHWQEEKVILSEVYDLGITPFNPKFMEQITLVDFYAFNEPETGAEKEQEFYEQLEKADVFIVLARRLWANSLANPDTYPRVANFYEKLFSGELGFEKTAEFYAPPGVGPLVIDDEMTAEETISVFDHPRIQIWERKKEDLEEVQN